MTRDANTPPDDSGSASASGMDHGAQSRRRRWRIAALLAAVALAGWVAFVVFGPPGDEVERQVARLMEPVRRGERNEKRFYQWVRRFENSVPPLRNIAHWILGQDSTSPKDYRPDEELQDLGDPAISILMRLAATDSSPAVRTVAVEALGTLGATNAFATVAQALEKDDAPKVRAAAAPALRQIDARAAGPPLLVALAREAGDVRFSILRAFGRLDPTIAFDPLMQVLQTDPSTETRRAAVEALGELRDRRAAPALRSLLATNNHDLRTAAISALGELRDREAVPALILMLESVMTAATNSAGSPADARADNDPSGASFQPWQFDSIRQALGQAMGKIGDARATDSLIRAMPRLASEWEVQTFLDALGEIGDPKSIPTLRSLIADNPKYAARAAQVLGLIGNADTTRELIVLLDSPDRETRVASAIALANLGEKAAASHLIEAMTRGPQPDAKRNIVEALGIIGDASAVPHLIEAATDNDEDVRTQAIWSLGNIGDRSASTALIRALQDSAFGVRFAGAFALAGLTNAGAIPALEKLLNDKERRIHTAAACSLAFHGSEHGLLQLTNALKRLDDWQRFGAVISLMRLNTPAARDLARSAVQDPDAGVRQLTAEALERGPVPALVSALKNGTDDHRHYAARMLLFFDDPAAIPALRAAVLDRRMEVRVAARVALRRLERATASK